MLTDNFFVLVALLGANLILFLHIQSDRARERELGRYGDGSSHKSTSSTISTLLFLILKKRAAERSRHKLRPGSRQALAAAILNDELAVEIFLLINDTLSVILPMICLPFAYTLDWPAAFTLMLCSMAFGYLLPLWWLRSKATTRETEVEYSITPVLEIFWLTSRRIQGTVEALRKVATSGGEVWGANPFFEHLSRALWFSERGGTWSESLSLSRDREHNKFAQSAIEKLGAILSTESSSNAQLIETMIKEWRHNEAAVVRQRFLSSTIYLAQAAVVAAIGIWLVLIFPVMN